MFAEVVDLLKWSCRLASLMWSMHDRWRLNAVRFAGDVDVVLGISIIFLPRAWQLRHRQCGFTSPEHVCGEVVTHGVRIPVCKCLSPTKKVFICDEVVHVAFLESFVWHHVWYKIWFCRSR